MILCLRFLPFNFGYASVFRQKDIMEARYYKVTKIEGEYATITDEQTGDEVFIALFLLPEGTDLGTRLKYEFLEYKII